MNEDMTERYVLVAVNTGDMQKTERSLEELAELLATAGGNWAIKVIQSLPKPNPATYVGLGKAKELEALMEEVGAAGILCDDELTPAQHRNLSNLVPGKVLDRTMLILDIFAQHARTREGKIQVEMAQLKFLKTRLTGQGTGLSRLGGGIGTRGPGETKLETDRRVIRQRISKLTADLKALKTVRDTTRKRRQTSMVPVCAIVGYTNAGKSSLLNRLTGADVLAENKLFATLDPTTRVGRLPGGQEILFTDTVGFIHKLPPQLIDAFHSTLEEALYADLILILADASSPDLALHLETVYQTLRDLGIKNQPVITVFNKADLLSEEERQGQAFLFRDAGARESLLISVRTGEGVEALCSTLERVLKEARVYLETTIPYADAARLARIHRYGEIQAEEYREDGVFIQAYVPPQLR